VISRLNQQPVPVGINRDFQSLKGTVRQRLAGAMNCDFHNVPRLVKAGIACRRVAFSPEEVFSRSCLVA
jgi:hypothetical protein